MKISGYTIIKNAVLNDYPVVESIRSILPVVDEMIVSVHDLFIPQAVTPNGDGKNDFFELVSLEQSTCSLQIFNRWGQIVYENSDYQNEWNGKNMNGDELENDTYFYVLLIDDLLNYNGYVVLKKWKG